MKSSQLLFSSFFKVHLPIPSVKQDRCELVAQQFCGMSTYEPEFQKVGTQE